MRYGWYKCDCVWKFEVVVICHGEGDAAVDDTTFHQGNGGSVFAKVTVQFVEGNTIRSAGDKGNVMRLDREDCTEFLESEWGITHCFDLT